MYCVTVNLFPVESASSPAMSDGDQRTGTSTDEVSVKETDEPDDKPLRFCVERAAGHYYLVVSAIAFLERNGQMFAQVERFSPMTSPCEIPAGGEQQIQLPASWPDIPFDELHSYGVVHPAKR